MLWVLLSLFICPTLLSGYVPGNVWIVSRRANSIKSDANVAELQMLTRNSQAKIAHD
jgi:hypothetical protein